MPDPIVFSDDFMTGAGTLDGRVATTGQTWVEDLAFTITCEANGARVLGAANRRGRVPAYLFAGNALSMEMQVKNNVGAAAWGAVFTMQDPVTDLSGFGIFVRRFGASVEIHQARGLDASAGLLHTFPNVAGDVHTYRVECDGVNFTMFMDGFPVFGPAAPMFLVNGMYPAIRIQNNGSLTADRVYVRNVAITQSAPVDPTAFWTQRVRTEEVI